MTLIRQADRVSYTFGMKLSDGNYGSTSINASLSSDVREGETLEDAMVRVQRYVESQVERKYDELKPE